MQTHLGQPDGRQDIQNSTKKGVCALLFLWSLWIGIALIPFLEVNALNFSNLLMSLSAIGSALWFWLLALGFGWKLFFILGFFHVAPSSLHQRLVRLSLSLGFGLGTLATTILVVGIFVGVSASILLGFLIMLVVFIGRSWFQVGKELQQAIVGIISRPWKISQVLGIALILGITSLSLPTALTPTLYPDTLRYHFGLTRAFEQLGRIAPIENFAETKLASNWQMIYLPQLLLAGDGCAQIFNWICLPFIATFIALAAGPGSWMASSLIFVSTPFLLGVSGLGNNDLGVTLFASMMWLVLRSEEIRNRFFWAGIFGGLAVGTKYPSVLVAIGVLASCWLFLKDPFRKRLECGLWFATGLSLSYLPWFIRNLLWTGDPFYPVLSRLLPWGSDEGRWVVESYSHALAHYDTGVSGLSRFFLAPWRLTVADQRYGFESDVGLIFWSAIPLILFFAFRRKNRMEFRFIVFSTLISCFLWLLGSHVTRFLAPLIPGAALLIGYCWKEWTTFLISHGLHKIKSFTQAFALILIGVNLWQAITSVVHFADPYHYLLGGMKRDEYLSQHSALYRIAKWLSTPERVQSVVLLFGEEEIYRFKNPVRVSGPFDRKWLVDQITASRSPSELAQKLKASGIEYLCINQSRIRDLKKRFGYVQWPSGEEHSRFIDFLKHETELVKVDQDIGVYRIKS